MQLDLQYTMSTESCTIRSWRVSGANFVKALKAIDDRKTNFSRVYLRNGQNMMTDQVRSHALRNGETACVDLDSVRLKESKFECIFWKTQKLHEQY